MGERVRENGRRGDAQRRRKIIFRPFRADVLF